MAARPPEGGSDMHVSPELPVSRQEGPGKVIPVKQTRPTTPAKRVTERSEQVRSRVPSQPSGGGKVFERRGSVYQITSGQERQQAIPEPKLATVGEPIKITFPSIQQTI